MKKTNNLVILVDSYYPNATMNGIVANRIIENLPDYYTSVRILTYQEWSSGSFLTQDDISISKVFYWSWFLEGYLSKKINLSKNKWFWNMVYYTKKIISNLIRNISNIGVDYFAVHKLFKHLVYLNQQQKIDTLLSIAAPFEFQVVNYLFKNLYPEVNTVAYQIDFWSELVDVGLPSFLREWRKKQRIIYQKKMAKSLSLVMIPFVYEKEGRDLANVSFCQLPLLRDEVKPKDCNNNNNVISFVYAGTLSSRERHPANFLKFIGKLSTKTDVLCHIYHRGDCNGIIEQYRKKLGKVIYNHGTVSTGEAYQAISSADVLVILGTPGGGQIAGKTFDYISTGKKILYIYQNSQDLNMVYLNRYPSVLCLDSNFLESEESIKLALEFIQEPIKHITFDQIGALYPDALPEYFCKHFL